MAPCLFIKSLDDSIPSQILWTCKGEHIESVDTRAYPGTLGDSLPFFLPAVPSQNHDAHMPLTR